MNDSLYPPLLVGTIGGSVASLLPITFLGQAFIGLLIIAAFMFGKYVSGGYDD